MVAVSYFGFNLEKYFSFSLSFLKILYYRVFSFPRDDTCSQTYLVYQSWGIGTVSCRYLSEIYSQNFLGFSITKYTTLPSSSSKMEAVDTSLNTSSNFSPRAGNSVNAPM